MGATGKRGFASSSDITIDTSKRRKTSGGDGVGEDEAENSTPLTELVPLFDYSEIHQALQIVDTPDQHTEEDPTPSQEVIEPTQRNDVEYTNYRSTIVGIRYYKGMVGKGESVILEREPLNPYDRNAIKVLNMRNDQVGHIPREQAAVLAPFMDAGTIRVEGTVPYGGDNVYRISLDLEVYGPRESYDQVMAALKPFIGTSSKGPSSSSAKGPPPQPLPQPLQDLMQAGTKADVNESRKVLDSLCQQGKEVSDLPLHPSPPALCTRLHPHQLQALAWMVHSEHPSLPTDESDQRQFWMKRSDEKGAYYLNVATNSPVRNPPELCRGGMLADDMGLGKTLTSIALILSDPTGAPLIAPPATTSTRAKYGHQTLIVAPLSVLYNWREQIDRHVPDGKLRYLVYYGADRPQTAATLKKYDVVITTYQTLAMEFNEDYSETTKGKTKPKKGPSENGLLYSIKWRRVILDEGHIIRNRRAKISNACYALTSERRWVLTGTPIINTLDDMFSLIKFLHFTPFNDHQWWNRCFTRSLRLGDRDGLTRLRVLMQNLCLRRTKRMKINGRPIVELPECKVFMFRCEFGEEEREVYKVVETESQRRVEEYVKEGTMSANYANVLVFLTRLRQICVNKDLCPKHFIEELMSNSFATPTQLDLTDENIKYLINKLVEADQNNEDCCVCLDTLKEPVVTPCAHVFCKACISEVKSTNPVCPMCRGDLENRVLLPLPPPPPPESSHPDPTPTPIEPSTHPTRNLPFKSTKIHHLLRFLKATPPNEKSLVFSQFTGMLDCVEPFLTQAGIRYVRFDGTMSMKRREDVLRRFSGVATKRPTATPRKGKKRMADEEIVEDAHVMLISLKCGALGLNLTPANHVYLLDQHWNSSIQTQAIDRVYRLGQTKPVSVVHIVVSDTIEERILSIQARKERLISDAFAGIRQAGKGVVDERRERRARVEEDLREIFGI
ncbi:uncharacterized protein SPPG_04962 [Spizellomyces punctatus DAOM BR117]|uniref:Uncharacterized protein n=1 Tax=Spizellomyces punctatus (strain DAOM BR117) TaxID=645134 RepID=A0A0L0HFM8_SPIPD|nr:uncharacterized protein SPPG_04962 [Spizellomyces punctatus DAOM BR117]KNC99573.1 hypothetical protein SPPG_04962 [Spizellomyces punctatus DAOM BR117]|eukprot:XP_016607613.1 hypothetical protein SPPG_04962 [Spizellomyces punctatus DAOM BR117]